MWYFSFFCSSAPCVSDYCFCVWECARCDPQLGCVYMSDFVGSCSSKLSWNSSAREILLVAFRISFVQLILFTWVFSLQEYVTHTRVKSHTPVKNPVELSSPLKNQRVSHQIFTFSLFSLSIPPSRDDDTTNVSHNKKSIYSSYRRLNRYIALM